MNYREQTLGAVPVGPDRWSFRVWAPGVARVDLHIVDPVDRVVPMGADGEGYHVAVVDGLAQGSGYFFRLDGGLERPDPASRWQPNGVHQASRTVDPRFEWSDQGWHGLPMRDYVIYELHVGTFSAEGTFDGVVGHLKDLKELGITAIELMPLAQFPGSRNWGYDGVYPFAVQESYGGPAGLKRLVNAAHGLGMAVLLDVVYNHLGPEGNYLGEFAPYFTDRYRTPWGAALNFDGPGSDEVRRYFIENALYWQTEFRIDGLRLDAVHAIRDFSAMPFLEELAEVCHRQADALNRRFHLIAESDMNMARHILPRDLGGYGLDAQWSDDFHHGLHVLLSGERAGYYSDFGGVGPFAKAWREGYAYTGERSRHRGHRQGSSPRRNRMDQFVVCSQNHDQIGNRMLGDRPGSTVSMDRLRVGAAAVLLAPFVPMLFMGEEYGETAPFQYFISHGDPALVEAVRKGRGEEFKSFGWKGEVPDPQAESTFQRCVLNHGLARDGAHRALRDFYIELLALRRGISQLHRAERECVETTVLESAGVLMVRQWNEEGEVAIILNFSGERRDVDLPLPAGSWRRRLDSASKRWGGSGESGSGAEVTSGGSVRLDLPASTVLVYTRSDQAGME